MPRRSAALRRSVRGTARRATGAAATRYRDAVLEQSRWLPAYLAAVDVADVTMRAARGARRRPAVAGPWAEPDPDLAAVQRACLSAGGELSLVLTGPSGWRQSVADVALVSGHDRVQLDGGLLEHAAERVRLCAPLPLERLTHGRWQVTLLDAAGRELPRPPVARRALPAKDGRRSIRLEVADGALVLLRLTDDPHPELTAIEHRVTTGIARLTVDWIPPPGTAAELLLLGSDGVIVQRIAGASAGDDRTLTATIDSLPDTVPAGDAVLTVAVPGPDAPVALVLAPGEYPQLSAAPSHGTARLGTARVRPGHDAANRLQLQVST